MKSFLPVLSLLAILSSATLFVNAAPDIVDPCTENWNGVQTSFSCNWRNVVDWISRHPDRFVPRIGVGIVAILVFLLIPTIMVFRYICRCCGSSAMRPGHGCCGGADLDSLPEDEVKRMYTKSEVQATKFFTVIAFVVAVVGCGVAFSGASESSKIASFITNAGQKFGDWVTGEVALVSAKINQTNPAFKSTVEQINDINSKMNKFIKDSSDLGESTDIIRKLILGLATPNALVVIVAILAVICAACNIRTVGPFVLLCLTTLSVLVCGALGVTTGLLEIPVNIWCDEVSGFRNNQTGLFKWYVSPTLCEDKVNFNGLKNTIENGVSTLTDEACDSLARLCDNNPTYVAASEKYYYCAQTPNTDTNCRNPDDLYSQMKLLKVKSGIAGETCAGTCNVQQCAANCSTSKIRAESDAIDSDARQASSAYNAIVSILFPILSCDAIVGKLLDFFDLCDGIANGLHKLYVGSAISVAACILLAIVLFFGQKRFFNTSVFNNRESESLLAANRREAYDAQPQIAVVHHHEQIIYVPAHTPPQTEQEQRINQKNAPLYVDDGITM